jgi:hypothetical protein
MNFWRKMWVCVRTFGFLICWILGFVWFNRWIERRRKVRNISHRLYIYLLGKYVPERLPRGFKKHILKLIHEKGSSLTNEDYREAAYTWVPKNLDVSIEWDEACWARRMKKHIGYKESPKDALFSVA